MEKQQLAKYISAAASVSLTGIGFWLGGRLGYSVAKEILAGVGLNVGSSLFQEQLTHLQSWISGEDGMLNHDIQKAWIRAAVTASETLERQYFDRTVEKALPKNEEAAIRSFFEDVRTQLNDRFTGGHKRIKLSSETLKRLQAEGCPEHLIAALRPIRRSFANETDLLDALEKRLAPDDFTAYQQQILAHAIQITLPFTTDEVQLYLDGGRQQAGDTLSERLNLPELLQDYPPDFTHFFEVNFLPQIQFFFKEELKKDAPENNKAWRAFQMMLLYGLRDDIATLRADQQAQFEKLYEAIATLERQPDDRRSQEPYWDRLLDAFSAFAEQALQGIDAIIATQAEHTEMLTEVTIRERLTNDELARLRRDAATLKETDFRIEQSVNGMAQGVWQVDARVQHLGHDVRSMDNTVQRIYAMLKNGGRLEDGAPPIVVARTAQFGHLFAEYTRLFAGREPELQMIREFLSRRQQRYACISAGPGFGKTALLANLIHESPNRYCYHFFNRNYDTHTAMSFLRNLCEQLCQYYRIGGTLPHDPEQLYALYWQLLMLEETDPAKPLILVFDGLDEAEDYFATHPILPPRLPQGKYIIFSARETSDDWLARFGLPVQETLPIPLEGLNASEIQRLLQQAGGQAAAFADSPELLAELRQVSQGDPFYLRFLVEDIVAGRITADNLSQMPSRAEEYFQQQLKQLQDSVTGEDQTIAQWQDAVLQFLFVADKGRLSRDDLIDLTGIKEQQFEKTMRPISRFLNEENDRYVFCHPRFRAYFSGRMPRAQQRRHADLMAYCARWQEHRSPYVLQYYPEHLLNAGQHDKLFALVRNNNFRQEQIRAFPDNPNLPLLTLQAALLAATKYEDAVQMAEFLLAHVQQGVTIMQESPLEALSNNNLQRAWRLADQHPVELRIKWHLLLIWILMVQKREQEVHETISYLQQNMPAQLSLDQETRWLLSQLYPIGQEQFFLLYQIIFSEPEEYYYGLCQIFIEQAQFDAAVDVAYRLAFEEDQVLFLCRIVNAQIQAKDITNAKKTLQRVLAMKGLQFIPPDVIQKNFDKNTPDLQHKNRRIQCRPMELTSIAISLVYIGNLAMACTLLQYVYRTYGYLKEYLYSPPFDHAWLAIAEAQAAAGQHAGAKHLFFKILTADADRFTCDHEGDGISNYIILGYDTIFATMVRCLGIEATIELGRQISEDKEKFPLDWNGEKLRWFPKFSRELLLVYVRQGNDKKAFSIIESFSNKEQLLTYCEIAEVQAQLGNMESAKETIQRAFNVAPNIQPDEFSVFYFPYFPDEILTWAVSKIAITQVRLGDVTGAIQTAQALLNVQYGFFHEYEIRSYASPLSEIAAEYIRIGKKEAAFEMLHVLKWAVLEEKQKNNRNLYFSEPEQMALTKGRDLILDKIAKAQLEIKQPEEAEITVQRIQNTNKRDSLLHDIAVAQMEHGKINDAFEIARRIGHQWLPISASRDEKRVLLENTLARIAEAQVLSDRVEDAVQTIKGIRNDELQIDSLHALADILLRMGKPSKAESILNVIKTLKCKQNSEQQINSLRIRADILILTRKSRKAKSVLKKIRELCLRTWGFGWQEYLPSYVNLIEKQKQANSCITDVRVSLFSLLKRIGENDQEETADQVTDEQIPLRTEMIQQLKAQISEGKEDLDSEDISRRFSEKSRETAENIKNLAKMLSLLAIEQHQAGQEQLAKQTLDEAYRTLLEVDKPLQKFGYADLLCEIACQHVRLGLRETAVQIVKQHLKNQNEYLLKLAATFVEVRDKKNFKCLLIPCVSNLDAAYAMCGHLARLYPEQAAAIAEVLLKQEPLDKKSEI